MFRRSHPKCKRHQGSGVPSSFSDSVDGAIGYLSMTWKTSTGAAYVIIPYCGPALVHLLLSLSLYMVAKTKVKLPFPSQNLFRAWRILHYFCSDIRLSFVFCEECHNIILHWKWQRDTSVQRQIVITSKNM